MTSTYTRSRNSYARTARVNGGRPATDRQLSTLRGMVLDLRLLTAQLTAHTDPADADSMRLSAQDHADQAVQNVRDSAARASDAISAASEALRSVRATLRSLTPATPAPAALPTTPTGDAPHTPAHRDVFRLADGVTVYRVQRSQSTGALYALALNLPGTGTDEAATWTYVPGGMRNLAGARLLTRDEALELSALICECVRCGRTLTATESVQRGIGPVCIKYFA